MSASTPLSVAIVGTGPSGFYAAEHLLKQAPGMRIDLFDRLPTPFGLVRGGVAPDHHKIKSVTRVYEKIAAQAGVRFLGHVRIGTDLTREEMLGHYHGVIYACGAQSDRALGVPGEDLANSHAATEFVGWYNGHPDYRDDHFDLSRESVAVIGMGNVAVDVVRILARRPEELVTPRPSTATRSPVISRPPRRPSRTSASVASPTSSVTPTTSPTTASVTTSTRTP